MERSEIMRRVPRTNTTPEIAVRKALHSLGYRFRLSSGRRLPGSPDVVLVRRRVAIFVHGCFWHRHAGCRYTTNPKTRSEFWRAKFEANIARDTRASGALEQLRYRVVVVWECETRDPEQLKRRLESLVLDAS